MPRKPEPINVKLYNLLDTRGFNPVGIKNLQMSPNAQTADAFNFTFKSGKQKIGTFIIAINNLKELIIFFSENAVKNASRSWTNFVKDMSNFATKNALSFKPDALDKFNDWLENRDFNNKKTLEEGYHGTKYTSTSDSTPETVRMFIRHSKALDETDQRFRHVEKIFVENQLGERFVLSTKKPSEGYVFARLIAEGGNPYDERGKHIAEMCEDIKNLGGFLRATRNNQFNESVETVIREAAVRYLELRETMKRLRSSRGFRDYFENWTPTLMENDDENSIVAEMFTQQRLDPRIESAIPTLNKLKISNTVVEELDNDDDLLDEDLSPSQSGDVDSLVELLSNDEELVLGPDATNAIEQIEDYIDDDVLFNRLKNASADPNADAKTIIIAWMREHSDDEDIRKILNQIDEKNKEGASSASLAAPTEKPKTEPKLNTNQAPVNKTAPTSSAVSSPESLPSAPPLAEQYLLDRIRQLSGLQK